MRERESSSALRRRVRITSLLGFGSCRSLCCPPSLQSLTAILIQLHLVSQCTELTMTAPPVCTAPIAPPRFICPFNILSTCRLRVQLVIFLHVSSLDRVVFSLPSYTINASRSPCFSVCSLSQDHLHRIPPPPSHPPSR